MSSWRSEPARTLGTFARVLAVLAATFCALPLLAQDADTQLIAPSLTLPGEIQIRAIGWSQLANLEEMQQFLLAVVETVVLTVLLAFHPFANLRRRGTQEWFVPQCLFLYGLIGMLVGFLVVHHGYLIGFVIFGVGGLFRFRMESLSLLDTALLIVVALNGLAIGLDLPVMAVLGAVAAWIVIWASGRQTATTVEIRLDDKADMAAAVPRIQAALGERGYRVLSATKTKFKPELEVVIALSGNAGQGRLSKDLTALAGEDIGIEDWHIA